MNDNLIKLKADLEKIVITEHNDLFHHKIPKEEYERLYFSFYKKLDNKMLSLKLCDECLFTDNESLYYFSKWLDGEWYLMIKRGEVYYADLSPVVGSEQGGIRPVLVVQNDIGNKYSPTIIAAAITSQINKSKLPTHIEVGQESGLPKDSVILLEQIRTLDKRRLKEKIGEIPRETMQQVNNALLISLGVLI